MLLMPEVLSILLLNVIFLLFGLVAFWLSLKIYLFWDIDATSQKQYRLERESFLATTIIKFIFSVKIPLFLFFIFTLDKISTVLKGAMCGAGVVDATHYGIYLMILKILNIYLFAFWLKLNFWDIKDINQPYTKKKSLFFIFLFLLLLLEIVLEFLMFNAIEIDKIVSCCGSIYSNSSSSVLSSIFLIDYKIILTVFYSNFLLMFVFYKNRYVYSILNLVFIVISLVSLILFFSPYIYELPTHHCPFCILQKDYFYVGYFIYTFLFIGTFYGVLVAFFDDYKSSFKISLLFNLLYVILLSSFVVLYYIKNGVFL